MDFAAIIAALQAIPGIGPVLPWLALAVAVCALLAAALPAPVAGGNPVYATIYRIINIIGANVGHASNASASAATPGPLSKPPLALLLVLAAGLSACGADGTLTPQALQTVRVFCAGDAIAQPIAITLVPTLLPQATPAAQLDQLLVHPAVVNACAAVGGKPASVSATSAQAAPPPAAVTPPKP